MPLTGAAHHRLIIDGKTPASSTHCAEFCNRIKYPPNQMVLHRQMMGKAVVVF
jgi:hypothetical protein